MLNVGLFKFIVHTMTDTMDTMQSDMMDKMLAALTTDAPEEVAEVEVEIVSLKEQIHYLKKNIDYITFDDKKSIGNILVMNNKRSGLKACNEGTVINLDILPPSVIRQMYDLLKYKMTIGT
jgi:hypothetical protein